MEWRYPIHRAAPPFTDMDTEARQLLTGIKVLRTQYHIRTQIGVTLFPYLQTRHGTCTTI